MQNLFALDVPLRSSRRQTRSWELTVKGTVILKFVSYVVFVVVFVGAAVVV